MICTLLVGVSKESKAQTQGSYKSIFFNSYCHIEPNNGVGVFSIVIPFSISSRLDYGCGGYNPNFQCPSDDIITGSNGSGVGSSGDKIMISNKLSASRIDPAKLKTTRSTIPNTTLRCPIDPNTGSTQQGGYFLESTYYDQVWGDCEPAVDGSSFIAHTVNGADICSDIIPYTFDYFLNTEAYIEYRFQNSAGNYTIWKNNGQFLYRNSNIRTLDTTPITGAVVTVADVQDAKWILGNDFNQTPNNQVQLRIIYASRTFSTSPPVITTLSSNRIAQELTTVNTQLGTPNVISYSTAPFWVYPSAPITVEPVDDGTRAPTPIPAISLVTPVAPTCYDGEDGSITISNLKYKDGTFYRSSDGDLRFSIFGYNTLADITNNAPIPLGVNLRTIGTINAGQPLIYNPANYSLNSGVIDVGCPLPTGCPNTTFRFVKGKYYVIKMELGAPGLQPRCYSTFPTFIFPNAPQVSLINPVVTNPNVDGIITVTSNYYGSGFNVSRNLATDATVRMPNVYNGKSKLFYDIKKTAPTVSNLVVGPLPYTNVAARTNQNNFVNYPSIGAGSYEVDVKVGSLTAGIFTNCGGEPMLTVQPNSNILKFNIIEPSILKVANGDVATAITCFGANNGRISVTPQGGILGTVVGTTAYSLELYNGTTLVASQTSTSTLVNFTSLQVGTYTLKLRDANRVDVNKINDTNYIFTKTYTITEPSAPIALSITGTTNVRCNGVSVGADAGSISVAASGGNGLLGSVNGVRTLKLFKQIAGSYPPSALQTQTSSPITALIPVNQTFTFSDLGAGVYKVVLSDAQSCTVSTTDFIISEPTLIAPLATTTNILCNGQPTGKISIQASGGTMLVGGSYDFTISAISPSTLPAGYVPTQSALASTNLDFSNLRAGTYRIAIKDANNCIRATNYTLSEPTVLSLASPITSVISCHNDTNGAFNMVFSGGVAPYVLEVKKDNVLMSGYPQNVASATTLSKTGLGFGIYEVTIKDANNCIKTSSLTLDNPSLIAVVIVKQNIACAGDLGNFRVNTTGGTTNNNDGVYSYTVTGVNGGNPVALSGQYLVDNLVGGTYVLSVRDAQNCLYTETIIIAAPSSALSVASSPIITPVTCFGESNGRVQFNISGGWGTSPTDYAVSSDNGLTWLQGTAQGNILSGLTAGTYNNIKIKDIEGCIITYPTSVVITQPAALQLGTPIISNTQCSGSNGSIQLGTVSGGTSAAGAYQYRWEQKNLATSAYSVILGQTITLLSGISAGVYRTTVTDANNCTLQSADYTVSDIGAPAIVGDPLIGRATCSYSFNADVKLYLQAVTGSGVLEVKWEFFKNNVLQSTLTDTPNQASVASPAQITVSKTGLSGLYDRVLVTIKSQQNCLKIENILLNPPLPLVVTATVVAPICLGVNNGSISVSTIGGNGTYTYLWLDNNSTRTTRSDLAGGTYTVRVTDIRGCTIDKIINIPIPAAIPLALGGNRTLCENTTYLLTAGVQEVGMTYQWSVRKDNGITTLGTAVSQSASADGEYIVKVTTAAGCILKDSVKINFTKDALVANFLMDSQITAGQTVFLFEVSRPVPTTVTWAYPGGVRVGGVVGVYEEVRFDTEGDYPVTLSASLSTCQATITKTLSVLNPRLKPVPAPARVGLEIENYTLYPNPSEGLFSCKVKLSKPASMLMKIYTVQGSSPIMIEERASSDNYKVDFDMRNYAKGLYLLTIQVGLEQKVIKFIID